MHRGQLGTRMIQSLRRLHVLALPYKSLSVLWDLITDRRLQTNAPDGSTSIRASVELAIRGGAVESTSHAVTLHRALSPGALAQSSSCPITEVATIKLGP